MTAHDKSCTFCQVISREVASYIVFEDDVSLAFLDRTPLFHGHCLLVPKDHYETLTDLPDNLITPIFSNVKLLAEAVEIGLKAEGTFLAVNNRISQSVKHLHIHIVPRRRRDGLKGFFWPRHPYKDQETILKIQNILQDSVRGKPTLHSSEGNSEPKHREGYDLN
jgi:histidine triad (HIT) family protein